MRTAAFFFALVAAGGCNSGLPVISGKVSYKNVPLTTGEVSFIAADGRSRSGLIGSDGTYEIRDAPEGRVTAVIVAKKMEGGAATDSRVVGKIDARVEAAVTRSLIPEKYGDPQTSDLSYVVARGRQRKDFELKD